MLLSLPVGVNAYEGYEDEAALVDPWEGFNRKVFAFNDRVDRWALRPAAQGYRAVTPDFMETGISQFFSNLGEIRNSVNAALQWKWGEAGRSAGRFVLNSTFGFLGVLDVASSLNVAKVDEDFGQTLGVWGVDTGPYVMLPFLGPSNVRDSIGIAPDRLLDPSRQIDDVAVSNSLLALEIISLRASLLDIDNIVSGDRYAFLRDAYLQRRNFLVNDGEVEDDFLEDDW
jgi:phospholipid-binding lipoprotein MlaA